MTSTYLEKRSVCVKCLSCFNSQGYFSLYLLTLTGLLWSQRCGEPAVMSLLTYSVRTNVLCGQIPPVSICVETDSRLTMRGYKTGSTHSGSADFDRLLHRRRKRERPKRSRRAGLLWAENSRSWSWGRGGDAAEEGWRRESAGSSSTPTLATRRDAFTDVW